MANEARGAAILDLAARRFENVIDGDSIDWQRWMNAEEKSRIIAAESLAEQGKKRLMLGTQEESGLTLPWAKTHGKVLIRPGKLCIWAGWTHHGKTQLVKQLMLHAMTLSERPLIASMEEEVIDVWTDLASMACGSSEPRAADVERFISLIRGKLWLYDQHGTVPAKRMIAVLRYAASELKITQAVVDSLMMLAVDRDDYEAQARFVGELKSVAKDTGMTVHLVCHMRKREGKGGDETPGTTHDIAGGHEIASKADYVFIPWRNKNRIANQPDCALKVDKQRGRNNWIGTVNLNFHQSARQFVEGVEAMRFWDDAQDF